MEPWELAARERIRDTLARYNWSGDSLRLDELALAFCDDGVLEIKGEEPLQGRDAIVERLRGVPVEQVEGVRRIVRHNVTNTRFVELRPDGALVASYFTVVTELGLDHYGRYRDTFVPVGAEWLIRHRLVSTDWVAESSRMARSFRE
jgi:hypothetical protein